MGSHRVCEAAGELRLAFRPIGTPSKVTQASFVCRRELNSLLTNKFKAI